MQTASSPAGWQLAISRRSCPPGCQEQEADRGWKEARKAAELKAQRQAQRKAQYEARMPEVLAQQAREREIRVCFASCVCRGAGRSMFPRRLQGAAGCGPVRLDALCGWDRWQLVGRASGPMCMPCLPLCQEQASAAASDLRERTASVYTELRAQRCVGGAWRGLSLERCAACMQDL